MFFVVSEIFDNIQVGSSLNPEVQDNDNGKIRKNKIKI